MSVRTGLYRHYSGNTLLYLGVSLNPVGRLTQHRKGAEWYQQIDTIKIEWFDTREAAIEAEREAIKSERPQFNKQHMMSMTPEERMAFIHGALSAMDEDAVEVFMGMFQSFGIDDPTDLKQWRARAKKIESEPIEPPLDLG